MKWGHWIQQQYFKLILLTWVSSYRISLMIAKTKKPYSKGENVFKVAAKVGANMGKARNEIERAPLSNDSLEVNNISELANWTSADDNQLTTECMMIFFPRRSNSRLTQWFHCEEWVSLFKPCVKKWEANPPKCLFHLEVHCCMGRFLLIYLNCVKCQVIPASYWWMHWYVYVCNSFEFSAARKAITISNIQDKSYMSQDGIVVCTAQLADFWFPDADFLLGAGWWHSCRLQGTFAVSQ